MLPAWLTDTVTSDLDRALRYTLLWGLEGVELRTVGRASDRVPFVNEEKLRRRLAEHEMPVVAVVPGLFEGPASHRATWLDDVAQLDETLGFCRRLGCPRVVVSAFEADDDAPGDTAADALRRAGTLAARRGLTLAVLNEAGMAHPTGAALARLLATVDHPAVRAAWNPAAAAQAGEDPLRGLEALAGRVELVRCTDGVLRGEAWHPTPLGEGAVGWRDQLRALHADGFAGPVSLEVNLEPPPRHGLRMATTLIAMIRAAKARK